MGVMTPISVEQNTGTSSVIVGSCRDSFLQCWRNFLRSFNAEVNMERTFRRTLKLTIFIVEMFFLPLDSTLPVYETV